MRRFFYRESGENGEKVEFSWYRTILTALIGGIIVTTISWITWVSKCSLGKEGLETRIIALEGKYDKQIEILHMRITKETDSRMDEFESLISRQLKLLEEQNRILYDLARENKKR